MLIFAYKTELFCLRVALLLAAIQYVYLNYSIEKVHESGGWDCR